MRQDNYQIISKNKVKVYTLTLKIIYDIIIGEMEMKTTGLIEEDFVNYKKASMFIGMGTCTWKCCKESKGRCE